MGVACCVRGGIAGVEIGRAKAVRAVMPGWPSGTGQTLRSGSASNAVGSRRAICSVQPVSTGQAISSGSAWYAISPVDPISARYTRGTAQPGRPSNSVGTG